MASTLSLRLQPPQFRRPLPLKHSSMTFHFFQNPNPNPVSTIFASRSLPNTPPSSPSWEREEQRWLREEQRWLREESRWIREESRWNAERESLLREIAGLRTRVAALELRRGGSVSGSFATVDSPAGPPPQLLVEGVRVDETVAEEKLKERTALRMGAEGEDVREMQDALQQLGFYSGEEDLEYSSFSIGTERAVKTWQASIGHPDDGIMTAKLLGMLFSERDTKEAGLGIIADQKVDVESVVLKDVVNGAVIASVTEVAKIQQKAVKETGVTETKVSEHRVFLLGENRWEEPSRLVGGNDKPSLGVKTVDASAKRCLSCRGEGRLMCTECDGSGEPNIEPQFLEWVDEGSKCPYCGGLGHTICDVCQGKGTA